MWTTESTLHLIEDLKMRRCLWDVSAAEYKDRGKKAEAVAELAQKYQVSSSEMDKKLHTLKGQFRREQKRLTDAKKGGGSPKKSTWFGYERLLFLLPVTESRGSTSIDAEDVPTIALSQTTVEEEVENADSLPQTPTFLQPPNRKRVCNAPDDVSVEALQCMKSLIAVVAKRDSFTIFADFVSDSLRTANRPQHEVMLAKQHITQIIFDLQNGVYADSSQSLHTTPPYTTASNTDGLNTAAPSPCGSDSNTD